MLTTTITQPPFTYIMFSFLLFNLNTWQFHLSLLLCIVYICVYFFLVNFHLWLVLIFFFNRIYYGFTPLRHWTSWHYTSWHIVNSLPNKVFFTSILGKILINIEKIKLDFRKIFKIFIENGQKKDLFVLLKTFNELCVENFNKVSFE